MATPKSHSSLKTRLLPSNSSSSQVRVVLRVRPLLPSEIDTNGGENPSSCISVLEQEHQFEEEVTVHLKDQWTSRNECYKLDSFFGQDDHVDQIFYKEVRKLIPMIFQGLNATIFAYGATGSGKTYTMQGTEDEPGLIPLAVSTILATCVDKDMRMEVSYYEVYMDRCFDLLEPKAKEIMAWDDKDGRVQLKGLSSVEVRTMEEFREVFSTGDHRRKVAHTGLNDMSSRSHGVLAIAITNGNAKGKLNLIDLAGNEDNRKTGNDGIRLQESAKINQSLFALSNVIYALNNNLQRIPYRESKLTRILQDSLGGTSQALMVACLNPISYQEAVHTVSLAARSRHIANFVGPASRKEAPREKVDMEAKLRAWLESKGKTKSLQRTRIFSPSSINCSKNSGSVKTKPKGRKLFDSGVPNTTTMEETSYCEVEDSKQDNMLHDILLTSNNDKDILESLEIIYPYGYDIDQDDMHLNNCSFPNDANFGRCTTTPHGNSQSDELQTKPFPNQISDDTEGQRTDTDVNISKPSNLRDTPYNKENVQSPICAMGSPAMSEKTQERRHSLRKVLSPIPSNVAANIHPSSEERIRIVLLEPKTPKMPCVLTCDNDEAPTSDTQLNKFNALSSKLKENSYILPSSEERIRIVLLEPKTPKTPCVFTCDNDEALTSDTQLNKFNALSSKLKESLVEKYLAFLNVASKEELLQLKGIGEKRAECILNLREQIPEPLKSLSDLEKIGLTSKQVEHMFKRAARGFFA